MAEWTPPSHWPAHWKGLASWAAGRWGWRVGDSDWPSALALLAAAEDEGHTALDWSQAPQVWARTQESDDGFDLPPPSQWPQALFDEGWLVIKGRQTVQTARNAALEARLIGTLVALASPPPARGGTTQEDAVARAGTVRLLVLAGGPGTGKTTTLRRLVEAWAARRPGLRTVVAAPTGRAAARAREAFASLEPRPECLTLHRLLGLKPGLGSPWHGPHRPLPFDLVIVDEASMVDLRTAVALTDALAPEASLVLVGDPGQLPSVEAGSVLADALAHPELATSVVRLTQRYRLSEGSATLARVFDLLQGQAPAREVADELQALGDGRASDFQWWMTEGDPGARALEAWGSPRNLALKDLAARILLSPVHRGPGGTETLGNLLDRQMGRLPGSVDHGTPWMIQRNLPHLGLQNGDRGLVVRREGRLWFTVEGGPAAGIPFSLVAEDGVSAWAVTVHKSQGSEYDSVVLVLPPGDQPGLVRELVYTGLTRAKTRATLVGSREALVSALERRATRMSGLGSLPPGGHGPSR